MGRVNGLYVVHIALLNFKCKKNDQKIHRDVLAKALTLRGQSQSHKLGKIGNSRSKGKSMKNEYTFLA